MQQGNRRRCAPHEQQEWRCEGCGKWFSWGAASTHIYAPSKYTDDGSGPAVYCTVRCGNADLGLSSKKPKKARGVRRRSPSEES